LAAGKVRQTCNILVNKYEFSVIFPEVTQGRQMKNRVAAQKFMQS
jgi:hypothetical protein